MDFNIYYCRTWPEQEKSVNSWAIDNISFLSIRDKFWLKPVYITDLYILKKFFSKIWQELSKNVTIGLEFVIFCLVIESIYKNQWVYTKKRVLVESWLLMNGFLLFCFFDIRRIEFVTMERQFETYGQIMLQ